MLILLFFNHLVARFFKKTHILEFSSLVMCVPGLFFQMEVTVEKEQKQFHWFKWGLIGLSNNFKRAATGFFQTGRFFWQNNACVYIAGGSSVARP